MGLTKLDVKDGDVVVLNTDGPISQPDLRGLVGALGKVRKQLVLLTFPTGVHISAMDEEAMKQAGWIRAPKGIILPTAQNVNKVGSPSLIKP